MVRRIKVGFAGREIEFKDRDRALKQIERLAEEGTYPVYVIYGPEGCGKTALLRQIKEILEEYNYYVVYVNPLAEEEKEILVYSNSIEEVVKEILRAFPEPFSRIVDVAISIASSVIRRFSRPRVAVLMDDIFQAVGLDKAERYVKILLNLIEWPPKDYEKIVVLVSSSEGVTRRKIGKHSWATFRILWNMSKEGFEELYEEVPDRKMSFEDVWRITGGNPRYLDRLYRAKWNVNALISDLVRERELEELVRELNCTEIEILKESLDNPDVLFERYGEAKRLIEKLIENNLIIKIWERDEHSWIDEPPPEKESELGIGLRYAWQTPLHREAIRAALRYVYGLS